MSPGLLRFCGGVLPVVVALSLSAQAPVSGVGNAAAVPVAATAPVTKATIPASTGATANAGPAVVGSPLRITNLRFNREKAVLGLPLGGSKSTAHCALDGTAFYDLNSSTTNAGQELFGVSQDGSVKHLLRKLPIDYTNVSVRDFFAGDHQLVTLLEADKMDDGSTTSPPRERDYFLSLEDEAGDSTDLVQMQLRFRPLKVARFGSGDVVVLGWDEGNLLPMIALVKRDGTIARFIDFDGGKRVDEAKEAAAAEHATLETLQGAAFVAYGSSVMLTYPGTTKPIRVLSSSGEMRTIPIEIPDGYVMNDLLVSSGRGGLVIRVKEAKESKPAKEEAEKPKLRVLEYSSGPGPSSGILLREFQFDRPPAADLTCAVNSTVSAVFYDTLPDANHAATNGGAQDPASAGATQLVVSTVLR